MNTLTIRIRLMQVADFGAVVAIDEKVLGSARPDYYQLKFEKLFKSREYLPTSLVAEQADGTVVGFVMGELYMGEYGIAGEGATLDSIGVDPACQQQGIGERLINEFMDHLGDLGVRKVNTLVDRSDARLMQFFESNRFSPSKTIVNLERDL